MTTKTIRTDVNILRRALGLDADDVIAFIDRADSCDMSMRLDLGAAIRSMRDFNDPNPATTLYHRITGNVAPSLVISHQRRMNKLHVPDVAREMHREWCDDHEC